jgi:hypothetical protein
MKYLVNSPLKYGEEGKPFEVYEQGSVVQLPAGTAEPLLLSGVISAVNEGSKAQSDPEPKPEVTKTATPAK